MPANTSPDNIIYPVSTDAVSPLETVFANMAQSVQDALTGNRTPYANVGALPGSAITGQAALVLTTPGAWWQWDGAAWQMRGVAQFTDGTARDSALTSPQTGWRSRIATESFDRQYSGSDWIASADSVILVPWTTDTAISSLNLDGLTGFSEYEVILDFPTSSTANDISAQLRSGGSPDGSSNYDTEFHIASATASSALQSLAQTSWPTMGGGARTDKYFRLRVSGLNEAQRTIVMLDAFTANASADLQAFSTKMRHRSSSAFDGIGITVSSGTVTGRHMVRGIGPI